MKMQYSVASVGALALTGLAGCANTDLAVDSPPNPIKSSYVNAGHDFVSPRVVYTDANGSHDYNCRATNSGPLMTFDPWPQSGNWTCTDLENQPGKTAAPPKSVSYTWSGVAGETGQIVVTNADGSTQSGSVPCHIKQAGALTVEQLICQ